MKHTKGPWKVEIHNGNPEIWNQNTFIATVRHDLFKTAVKENQYQANAKLMAAAPEMYNVLVYLSKLNIGDDLVERIEKVLSKIKE